MQKYNILQQNNIYIEFGAGKGNLSHEIATHNKNQSGHLLLEMEARRFKLDKFHRNNPNYKRILTDISDIQLDCI